MNFVIEPTQNFSTLRQKKKKKKTFFPRTILEGTNALSAIRAVFDLLARSLSRGHDENDNRTVFLVRQGHGSVGR